MTDPQESQRPDTLPREDTERRVLVGKTPRWVRVIPEKPKPRKVSTT